MSADEPPPPNPARDALFAKLDVNLADLLARPVIRDHPEWQVQIRAFTRQYADMLVVQTEVEKRRQELDQEIIDLREKGAGENDHTLRHLLVEVQVHEEAELRTLGHLAELNDRVTATFDERPQWLDDYIRDFLNPDKGAALVPGEPSGREAAAERLLGSIVICAIETVKALDPQSVVHPSIPDNARWTGDEYEALEDFQRRLAFARKAASPASRNLS